MWHGRNHGGNDAAKAIANTHDTSCERVVEELRNKGTTSKFTFRTTPFTKNNGKMKWMGRI